MENGCLIYFLKYKKKVYRERKRNHSISDIYFKAFNS